MHKEFDMSMIDEISFVFGLQVIQIEKVIFISQTKYIEEMLKKFGMENSKSIATPMATCCKLSKDDGSLDVDQKQYRPMIRGLLYLTTLRPDITQAICLVARYQANPKK